MNIVRRVAVALTALSIVGALVVGGGVRAASRLPVKEFLSKVGFTTAELAALDRGEAVARVLKKQMVAPNQTAEIGVVGAIRVDVPRQVFLDGVQNVRGFRDGSHLELPVLQDPPRTSDFAALKVPEDDIKDLEECRPGKCALKLAGGSLEELQSRIDWGAPDRDEQVNRFAREQLMQLTLDYARQKTAALEPLKDKETGISRDRQFRELLAETPNLIAFYPELATYLREYPKAKLASSSDVLFWAHRDFGLKPTVTITHAVGYMPEGTEDAVVAWKLIYASHYFNGGLNVTTYAKDGDASYLVQLVRKRADSLGGMFGGVKRGKMASAIEDNLVKFLQRARKNLQAATK